MGDTMPWHAERGARMPEKEATARITINKLLEAAGWRFFAAGDDPVFSTKDFKAVPAKYRTLIPEYIKDYVSLNQFAA